MILVPGEALLECRRSSWYHQKSPTHTTHFCSPPFGVILMLDPICGWRNQRKEQTPARRTWRLAGGEASSISLLSKACERVTAFSGFSSSSPHLGRRRVVISTLIFVVYFLTYLLTVSAVCWFPGAPGITGAWPQKADSVISVPYIYDIFLL